ncbi:MAG: hypothetical protein ACFFAD_16895 [Candidatus Hermodarchaeota archaeon]
MNRKSILGLTISALSILLTLGAVIAFSSLPQYLEYHQYEENPSWNYYYEHGQEEEIFLIVNNTVLEASHSFYADQLRLVSIHIDGGPVSIALSVSGFQILSYPSVANEVLNGTTYPPENHTPLPNGYPFVIEVHGTGSTANVSIIYTIGFIIVESTIITTGYYISVTEAYYGVLSSCITLLIGGAIAYLVRVLYSVALSVKPDFLLPIAGLLTPQIILTELNQWETHSASYITSLWKFAYAFWDDSASSYLGNIASEGNTFSIINSINQPLSSALVISSLLLAFSVWLLIFGKLRPRFVSMLALLDFGVIVAIALSIFQESPIWSVEFGFIPVPIMASGMLILTSMWPRISRNENQ